MPSKTLIVGDIHGCWDEFQDLLRAAGIGDKDEVIAVGDIVDRGPDSPKVLEFFRTRPGALCVRGNHERKHVLAGRGESRLALSQQLTRHQLGDSYDDAVAWMSELPGILDTEHALVLHWGFDPRVSLVDQDERVLAGAGSRRRGPDAGAAAGPRWVRQYRGPKPIVFGHRTLDQRFVGAYAINLGAHCFCGQHLFGILLPQRLIYAVKAKRDYWAILKERALAVAVSCGDHIAPARRAKCCFGALEQLVREGRVSRQAEELYARASQAIDFLVADMRRRSEALFMRLPKTLPPMGSPDWFRQVMPRVDEADLRGFLAATARGTGEKEAILRAHPSVQALIMRAEQRR